MKRYLGISFFGTFFAVAGTMLCVAPLDAQTGAATSASAVATPAVTQMSVGVVAVKISEPVTVSAKRDGRANELAMFAKTLEAQLAGKLAATRKFKVVTRADLDTVAKEQDLAASGNVDTSDAQLARRFKLAGVSAVLQVTVTDFQDRVRTLHSAALDQTLVRRDIRVLLSAALLDTTTGVIRESIVIEPLTQGDLEKRLTGLRDTAESGDEIAAALAVAAATRISDRLADVCFPARVLSRAGDTVLINRGDATNVVVGQEWVVYAQGEALVDPDTGEKLGASEVEIGRVVITERLPKFSRARILKDQGIANGQVLRLAPKP